MYFCVPVYLSTRHCIYPVNLVEAKEQHSALGQRPDQLDCTVWELPGWLLGCSVCFEVAVKMCVTACTNKQWCALPHSERAAVDVGIAAGSNNNVITKRNGENLTVKINPITVSVISRSYREKIPRFVHYSLLSLYFSYCFLIFPLFTSPHFSYFKDCE